MPAPNFRANSSFASGTNAITMTLPTGYQAGDILVACIMGANTSIPAQNQTNMTNNGWARIANSNSSVVGAATANVFLDIWWQRASTAAQTAVVLGDAGDHTLSVVTAFQNCIDTGDPFDGSINVTYTSATAQVTSYNVTTSNANTLVCVFIAGPRDSAAAQINTGPLLINNSDGTELTERFDFGTSSGSGSTLGLLTYRKPTSGAVANVRANTATAQTSIVHLFTLVGVPDPTVYPWAQAVMF